MEGVHGDRYRGPGRVEQSSLSLSGWASIPKVKVLVLPGTQSCCVQLFGTPGL